MGAPRFTWSDSRNKAFSWCLRKYFYHYYGYQDGWLSTRNSNAFPPDGIRSEEARRVFFFKKLDTIPMWLGLHIHGSIASVLDGSTPKEEITEQSIRDAIESWQEHMDNFKMFDETNVRLVSTNYQGRIVEKRTKEHPFFVEQLSKPINRHDLDTCIEKIESSLDAFLNSEIPEMFEEANAKDLFTFVESRDVKDGWGEGIHIPYPEKLDTSEDKELFVHTKVDCAVEESEGKFHIFDWKTGSEPRDSYITSQLLLYADYLEEKITKYYTRKGIDRTIISIESNEIYLPSLEVRGGVVTRSEIDSAKKDNVIASNKAGALHQKLSNLMFDFPRDDTEARALCPTTPEPSCASCNWQTHCKAGKEILGL